MVNFRLFLEKHFLLLLYVFFLGLDCYFLYKGSYQSRIFSKPVLMVFLMFWFHRRTALSRVGIPPQSWFVFFCVYAVFILSFVSDVCALWSDIFFWSVCRLLYIPIYLVYLLLLIKVQRVASGYNKLNLYWNKALPVFLLAAMLAIAVLWKAAGFGTQFYHWCLYLHSLIICLVAAATANTWGYEGLAKCRPLFAAGVVFIILTNTTFCFDELHYNRRFHILDVLTALGNGASTVLMLLATMRFVKDWWKI